MSATASAPRAWQASAHAARRALIAGIRVYQLAVSPHLAPACRFEPSCSRYAAEAIARYGVMRGVRLAAARIGRCNPWGGSGCDPVP